MKKLSLLGKAATVAVAGAGAIALTAAPASAASPAVAIDLNTNGTYAVASTCNIAVGYTTDIRFVTYVVKASADAAGPSVALATGVTCTVYSGGSPRGGASGSLVGPHAEAVGQAVVPVGQIPTLCVSGSATFLDGTSVPAKPCP